MQGILTKMYEEMTEEKIDLVLKLLSKKYNNDTYQHLYNLIEDNASIFSVIDVFADKEIRFPDRDTVIKYSVWANIYYDKVKDITVLSKKYNKSATSLAKIIEKIDRLLSNTEIIEKE